MAKCKFRSSYGGSERCWFEEYLNGFCEFHNRCFMNEEIDENGVIKDRVTDQNRRREINFHGAEIPNRIYLSD
ncbi:MAG: hypothetical protein AB1756_03205 [Acidobacteriota bacterium]